VFSTLEHVPSPGEVLKFAGWHFTAEEVEGRRIRLVRVRRVVPDDELTSTEDASASN
jgi:CBS domain containing-hemolysin-like protein